MPVATVPVVVTSSGGARPEVTAGGNVTVRPRPIVPRTAGTDATAPLVVVIVQLKSGLSPLAVNSPMVAAVVFISMLPRRNGRK